MSTETQTGVPIETSANTAQANAASSPSVESSSLPSATSSEPPTVDLDIVYESIRIERHYVDSELDDLMTKRRAALAECFLRVQKVFGADITRLRNRLSRLNGALAELDKVKEPVNDVKPTVEPDQSGAKPSIQRHIKELVAILEKEFPLA